MILQVKCDACGKVGRPNEIYQRYNDGDLCDACGKARRKKELAREIKEKKEWLESTHMKDLRELEKQLAEIEQNEWGEIKRGQ